MPLYHYRAKNLQSKTIQGQKAADDEKQVSRRLREENLFLIKWHEIDGGNSASYRLKPNDLSTFTRELGTMLSSGITLIRAMEILIKQDNKPKIKKLYTNLYDDLKQGNPFSEALDAQGKAFPKLMISMFRAGEANGSMDLAAKKVSLHYEKEHKIQSKIKGAMTYPIILLIVAVMVMLAVFTLILPTFFDLFADIELPTITKIVISISYGLTNHWLIIIIITLIVLLGITFLLQLQQVQLGIDRFKLKLPKIGNLLTTIYTARFARTLSTLYTSGLSMLQALSVAADTIGNQYIANQFDEVIKSVQSGGSLSEALERVHGFSPKLSSVTFIGEESGRLDELLNSTADSFDFESERAVEKLITILEPAMIVLLAFLVGTIMISVLLPLYTMYQSIG
jgi:type IV pilus assembly protein PilC